MKTVVIEVRGGVVQAVYADEEVRAILVDWDERADDPLAECACLFPVDRLSGAPEEADAVMASAQ